MPPCRTQRRQLDSPKKNRFIGAIQTHGNVAEACRTHDIPYQTGLDLWHKYDSTGSTSNLPRSGRPKIASDHTKRVVVRNALKSRRTAFQDIGNTVEPRLSEGTVRNILAEEGLHRRVARKVPFLTKEHKRKRLEWAKACKGFTEADWDDIAWSDEAYICLGENNGRIFVTCRADEELLEECLVPTFKQSSVRVMVWAVIMRGVKGPMVVLEYPGGKGGGMTSARYQEQVLDAQLVDFHADMAKERTDFHFQQDGAPSHRSASTRRWFDDHDIPLFLHPPNSPDLSPIEPVWHELKKRLRSLPRTPTTWDQLGDAVLEVWNGIPFEDVDKYIDRMPEVVQAVLDAKGGHTKY